MDIENEIAGEMSMLEKASESESESESESDFQKYFSTSLANLLADSGSETEGADSGSETELSIEESGSESEWERGTSMEEQPVVRGVVALKGQPSTCKTEVAHRIGSWAKCPVLCIQDLLGGGGGRADYYRGVDADFTPPTVTDQVERHHRKAFTALLNMAHRHLSNYVFNCVVIKSSLNTPSELLQLLQLGCEFEDLRVIILECRIRNKYLWKRRFEEFSDRYRESRSWSRPRSWKDIDKVVDDDDDDDDDDGHPPSWDLSHLHHFLQGTNDDPRPSIIWLGVDPFYDLSLSPSNTSVSPLPNEFNDAITYLLTAPKQKLPQNPYVAEYNELRQFLFDKKLRDVAQEGRSQSFCEGGCVFRYWEKVPPDYEAEVCGVCKGRVSQKPAYSCHFCVTTLHKKCAERIPINILHSTILGLLRYLNRCVSVQYPCKVCQRGRKEFSEKCRSCIFQDRLKCHFMPPIFNHNSHQHFLSIQLHKTDCSCRACGSKDPKVASYGCKRCAFYCDMACAFLPLELKHEHGGHEHAMKLMYTRDSMEVEEDPCWCDCCYQDMDPELWFYSCKVCPHYVVHLDCSRGYRLHVGDQKMVKFVEQLQSRVDAWRALQLI